MKKVLLASIMVALMLVTVLSAGYSANAMSISVKNEDIIGEDIKSNDEDYIYYYDEATAGWNGMGPCCECCNWKSAIRLTQDELEQYNEWNLTGVNVLRWGGGEHSGIIEVFGEGTPSEPGPIITSTPYYFNEFDWFRVNLNESVPIKEHNEIWIAVEWCTKEPYIYPAAVDEYPPVIGKSDWVYLPNSEWLELYQYGFPCNWCMEAIVQRDEINQPPESPTIIGPTHGKVEVDYEFTFVTTDPDEDYVTYYIDWDDGNTEEWGPYPSAMEIILSHNWTEKGCYLIRCKAIDIRGLESDWGTITVTIPRNRLFMGSIWLRFLDMFPILQRILNLIK